jgi:hypothetical protein
MMGSTTSWMMREKLGWPIHCAMFFFRPVNMLSTTVTWCPAIIKRSTKWLPTKPEPPVTSIRRRSDSGMFFTGGKLAALGCPDAICAVFSSCPRISDAT